MDYKENMINILARDIVEDHLDTYGLDKGINLLQIDQEKLIEIAVMISESRNDLLDMMADDQCNDMQSAIFNLLIYNPEKSKIEEFKECFNHHLLRYYGNSIKELLNTMYSDCCVERHIELGQTSYVDEQTGEVLWR